MRSAFSITSISAYRETITAVRRTLETQSDCTKEDMERKVERIGFAFGDRGYQLSKSWAPLRQVLTSEECNALVKNYYTTSHRLLALAEGMRL